MLQANSGYHSMIARTLRSSSAVLLCLLTSSCGGGEGGTGSHDPLPVSTTLNVSPSPATLPQAGTLQLAVEVLDQFGDPIAAYVTFRSGDPSVIKVSADGLLQAVGRALQTTVVIQAGALSKTLLVAVSAVPASVRFTRDSLVLGRTGVERVPAVILDLAGDVISALSPLITPEDPGLLSILPGGAIRSIGGVGSTTVRATYQALPADTLFVSVLHAVHPAGQLSATLNTPSHPYGVAISIDRIGYILNYPSSTSLLRVDLATSLFLASIPGVGAGLGIAVNHAGTQLYVGRLAAGGLSSAVVRVDVASATVTDSLLLDTPWAVAVSPDDQLVFVTTNQPQMLILDAGLGLVDSVTLPNPAIQLAVHPTLPLVYASGPGGVTEVNTSTHTVGRLFSSGARTQGVAVSPDGTQLYVVTETNVLTIWDLQNGGLIANILGAGGYGAAVSPDGERLYVTGTYNIKLIDLPNRVLLDSVVVSSADRVAFSYDGGTALVTDQTGHVHILK